MTGNYYSSLRNIRPSANDSTQSSPVYPQQIITMHLVNNIVIDEVGSKSMKNRYANLTAGGIGTSLQQAVLFFGL